MLVVPFAPKPPEDRSADPWEPFRRLEPDNRRPDSTFQPKRSLRDMARLV
jgi:hypothetical protein